MSLCNFLYRFFSFENQILLNHLNNTCFPFPIVFNVPGELHGDKSSEKNPKVDNFPFTNPLQ